MKFKNNITYKDSTGKTKRVNFKTQRKMIEHLDKNKHKLHDMNNVRVNFGVISLPIKDTVWNSAWHFITNTNATLAQLVEHLTCNEDVVGSIPTGGSILGEMAELA